MGKGKRERKQDVSSLPKSSPSSKKRKKSAEDDEVGFIRQLVSLEEAKRDGQNVTNLKSLT